ncbi:MAG: peptidase M20 [Robiginitomaculum sp.]|nr:MAG: peptidase M20 [Robiginitomaculum sp.]
MRLLTSISTAVLAATLFVSSAQAEDLLKLYKYLHANPELSLMETKTAALLAGKLEKLGFDVTENVGGTGVVSVMKNGDGPTIMIRADMDGLPVKEQTGVDYASKIITKNRDGIEKPAMHACGHDIHMTVLIGTAEKLVASKADWSGTLVLVLQPAEELGLGARMMLADGLFTRFPRPDYNLALHDNPALATGKVGIVPGYALANVDSVDITVRGIGGHGAYPHTTKDPIVLAAQLVTAMQTIISRETSPLESAVLTVGSIHGGSKHNIISDEVKLQLTLRSYKDDVRMNTINSIKRIADGLGRAAGLPDDKLPIVTVRDAEFTPATYNNPELAARLTRSIGKKIGAENVKAMDQVMGGEDFGAFGRTDPKIPSMLFWLGAVSPEKIANAKKTDEILPSLHSPFFVPDAEPTINTGVEAMTAAALDLFQNPE